MKKLFSIILIIASLTVQAQFIIPKEDLKPVLIRSGILMLSGGFDATAEVLRINYDQFAKVHPNANQNFWNPNESWRNKWKNGDPNQGEKYFFASTALVWTTDAYHLARTGRNITAMSAIIIPIGKRHKKPFKQYAAEFVIYYVSYTAGFNLVYNGIYKMP